MRPTGTPVQLEARRQQIAVLLEDGRLSNQDIADAIGVHSSTVNRCQAALKQGGVAALAVKLHLGPQPIFTSQQRQRLLAEIEQGAQAAGFSTELWTCKRIAEVV